MLGAVVLDPWEPERKCAEALLSKTSIHSCMHSLSQQQAPTIKVRRETQKDKSHEGKLLMSKLEEGRLDTSPTLPFYRWGN